MMIVHQETQNDYGVKAEEGSRMTGGLRDGKQRARHQWKAVERVVCGSH